MAQQAPQNKQPSVIPAAIGYPQRSPSMIPPVWSNRIIARFRHSTMFGEITNMSYFGDIQSQGDTVYFYREPNVSVHTYQKDGPMKAETPDMETFSLHINRSLYWGLKVDCIDQMQMPMFTQMQSMWIDSTNNAMANVIEKQIFGQVFAEAHPSNSGKQAGCECGAINLGATNSPRLVTPKDLRLFLGQLDLVLDEQCVPREGRFVVLPLCAKLTFSQAFANTNFVGSDERAFAGGMSMRSPVFSGTIYFSKNVCPVTDPDTGKTAYNVLFGHRDALAFATQITKTAQTNGGFQNPFDNFWFGLQVYGFGVALPEALGHAYLCFDDEPELLCC